VLASVPDGKITPFLEGGISPLQGGSKAAGQISPDGKWVAYESNETGEWKSSSRLFTPQAGNCRCRDRRSTAPMIADASAHNLLQRSALL